MDRQTVLGRLQSVLATGLETTLESVLHGMPSRCPIEDPVLRKQAIDALISAASRRVATLSACNSLTPGWAGMLSLGPSLIGVTREQLCLVRDVAQLNGIPLAPSGASLLAVMAHSMGKPSATCLPPRQLVLQWEACSLQTVSLRLANSMAHQVAGAAVSRWLPAIGPAALSVWSGYTTSRIGKTTHAFFSQLAAQTPDTVADLAPAPSTASQPLPPPPSGSELELCKLQALIGLARVDGRVCDNEREFIAHALADPRISDEQRTRLQVMLEGSHAPLDGLEILARHPDAAVALLTNLAILAWKDGQLHHSEKLYIRQLGKLMGFDRSDVDELLGQAAPLPA